MDLNGYLRERLREDREVVLYRCRRPDKATSILALAPVCKQSELAVLARFERENDLADDLDVGWAIKPLGLARHEGRPVLLLSDPGGQPLDQRLGKPLELEHFLKVAIGLAAALRQCHGRGLVHKDIKPAHVFVDVSGHVRLSGFGYATRLLRERQSIARPDDISGTLAYMAPEQTGRMNRPIDTRSDLYALGVSLYELLTGALPFSAADPAEWIHCHIARVPPPPGLRIDRVPAPLEALILKLLAKNADDRYQTAAGVEHDLAHCLTAWRAEQRIEPFPLAARDALGQLRLPEKIFGRETELDRLARAFERVALHGKFELLLVSGPSGVGKSSLVNELRSLVYAKNGLFAAGKFDQYKRDAPYATLAEALRTLLRQVLGKDDAELGRWRSTIGDAVGAGRQLMANLIPELDLILAGQPPLPILAPQEEVNRFNLVFRSFISAFAKHDHPLVLFLDDLQWIDSATLTLLELLCTDEEIPHLFLVAAFRSDEDDASHGLGRVLARISATRRGQQDIRLGPLNPCDLGRLLEHSLHASPETVAGLADLMYQKTKGNPLFAVQLLTILHNDGDLSFDTEANAWRWNANKIRVKTVNDNVLELVASRLARYSYSDLEIIKRFACIGVAVPTAVLSTVLGISERAVDIALRSFVSADLLYHVENGYAFSHDGIRDAAYLLIPEHERAAVHLELGRLLSKRADQKQIEENVFDILSQLNRGASLISASEERQYVAELNLLAGRRAKAAAAYEFALSYLAAGQDFLLAEAWGQQYRLAFDISFHRADCEFMIGEIALAESRLQSLHELSRDPSDLALVVGRQVILYTYQGRIDRALGLAVECLARMGVILAPEPTDNAVEKEYSQLLAALQGRTIESLIDLPKMEDPKCLEIMDLLQWLAGPAAVTDANLLDLVLLRMVNLSIAHGNTDELCHAYANVGGRILGWRFHDFDAGSRFGRLAIKLMEERGLDRFASRVYAIVSGVIGPWSMPLRDCYAVALRAIEMPRERGGIAYGGYAWVCGITAWLDSGKTLADVHQLAEAGLTFARKSKFSLVVEFISAQILLIRALRGLNGDFSSFSDGAFDEDEYERYLEKTPHLVHAKTRYRICKLQLQYYAGNYNVCVEIASKVGGNIGESPILEQSPVFEVVEYCFFSALARASVLSEVPPENSIGHFDALRHGYNTLTKWAEYCPKNIADRACLVGAELARLEGRELDAERQYEQAIRLSRENDFLQNEALGYELAGRFYSARGFEIIAEAYLRYARDSYSSWGAHGKVLQLERQYPHLVRAPLQHADAAVEGGRQLRQIDLAAMAKMNQAVSGEIVLDRLIERLMVAVLEHAGAVRGLLLLSQDGAMRIVAEAATGKEQVTVEIRNQSELSRELPQSVINYVIRTRDVVMIDDAMVANPYSSDVYIRRVQARSVLCLPLVKQQRLVGILYLENNLASHTFTPDRISILHVLASQAAISIENAQLFLDVQNTQQQARAVSDELRRSFDWIPALAWRASANGAFEFANKQWHDYTGVSPQEARAGSWIRSFHADDTDRVMQRWRDLLAFGTSGQIEARICRFDGEVRNFLVHVTPMRDEMGNIVKWHGTGTDIEGVKRAEQAQEALARVSRVTALGELTVSIAHEVNQPLMSIVTNAAACSRWLAGERPNIQEARFAAERIIRDGHRAGDVIASIRALAKKSSPETTKLDLNDAIAEVLLLTRNEIDRHNIATETDLSKVAESVLGDRVQIQQVILNLILNSVEAIGATEHQPRLIKISTQRGEPGFVLVTVADTGVGLGQSGGEQIFEVFFTTKADGIGIGLSICRSIVEAHRGRLWASRNHPRGTVFSFTVPIFAPTMVEEHLGERSV